MGAVQGFLSNYSVNFQLALFAWPFFSVALTLPILAYIYHRDGRLRFPVVCGTYVAVLYLLGIVCFAFYPLPTGDTGPGITYGVPPQWNPLGFIGDIAEDGLTAVFQLLFNIVFLRMRRLPAAHACVDGHPLRSHCLSLGGACPADGAVRILRLRLSLL